MFELIYSILTVSGFSILFNGVLQDKGMILSWKPNLIRKILSLGKAKPLQEYSFNLIQNRILQVLVICPKCLSFWVAIAWYLIRFNSSVTDGIEFVTLCVFVTYLLTEKY